MNDGNRCRATILPSPLPATQQVGDERADHHHEGQQHGDAAGAKYMSCASSARNSSGPVVSSPSTIAMMVSPETIPSPVHDAGAGSYRSAETTFAAPTIRYADIWRHNALHVTRAMFWSTPVVRCAATMPAPRLRGRALAVWSVSSSGTTAHTGRFSAAVNSGLNHHPELM